MKFDEAKKLVCDYESKYRHPELEAFLISEKYDLFPTEKRSENCWPHRYPHADRTGVYMIMDSEDNILYIGKSSVAIGKRLGSYFSFSSIDGESCHIKDANWTTPPRYLATIAVPVNSSFESASLEEFLLSNISTSDNYNLLKR